MSVIGKVLQVPRIHGILVSVRCKSDRAGFLKWTRLGGVFFNGVEENER